MPLSPPSFPRFLALWLALLTTASAALAEGRVILVAREAIADPEFRRELAAIGGPEASRFVLALTAEEKLPGVDRCFPAECAETAGDRELCRRIGEVDVLVIRGGTFMEWFDTLYPDSGPTHLQHALLDRVRSKKTVIAYGGASAFLSSGTSIPAHELDEPERNPRRQFEQVARVAMGLGPRALIDSDDLPEGTPFRLLRALWWTRVDLGFHLVGDVALDYRREGGRLTVTGPGQVIVCDLRKSRRMKRSLREARLSVLRAGDGWDFVYHRPTAAPGKERVPLAPREPGRREARAKVLRSGPALVAALEALFASPTGRGLFTDEPGTLEIRRDRGTEVRGTGGSRALLGAFTDCFWD